jgi:hypothetical protein
MKGIQNPESRDGTLKFGFFDLNQDISSMIFPCPKRNNCNFIPFMVTRSKKDASRETTFSFPFQAPQLQT